MDRILDLYAILEFSWANDKKDRCYFFNKNCVLFFCVKVLEIDTAEITTLKDKARVDTQVKEMCELLERHYSNFGLFNIKKKPLYSS